MRIELLEGVGPLAVIAWISAAGESDLSIEIIQQLAELGFHYGPFLFSVLFLITISRWTYKRWRDAATRTPPAAANETGTLRGIFVSSFVMGCGLVIASVVWWFIYLPQTYVLQGHIRSLFSYEKVQGDNFYFHPEEISDFQQRNEHFVFLQHTPFRKGQNFILRYKKGEGQEPVDLEFAFDPSEPEPIFQIVKNPGDDKPRLVRQKQQQQPGAAASLWSVAYGQTPPPRRRQGQQTSRQQMPRQQPEKVDLTIVSVLQEERSDVGQKISALKILNAYPPEQLSEYLRITSQKESMLLTILDLARHSDPELALLAQRITGQPVVASVLAGQLADPATRRLALDIWFRLDQRQAEQLLSSSVFTPQVRALLEEQVQKGRRPVVLYPVGSEGGDRYYVQASWNPTQAETLDCVTRLFYDELINKNSFAQELQKTGRQPKRTAYWYSKAWALGFRTRLLGCGAAVTFPHPGS